MSTPRPELNTNKNISQIVRTLLGFHARRQADLAVYLGMDSGTMSKTMHGARKWTVDDVTLLAAFFGESEGLFFE